MLGSAAASFAFAALAEDRIPNEQAIALSPTIGWLLLGCAVFAYLIFALQTERWRRFWLTAEDPRPIALFRIVFGFLCICNINDLFEYFEFLFTDEGIFLSDAARQLVAAGQFKGFGDGIGDDPYGFFDGAGWIEFLKGQKYSLLYFYDTPRAMWIQMLAFYGVTVAFMLGWKTRVMGVLSFLLMNSFFLRNHLFWEGTELVYRVFFFYLLLARSGHAYSIDNWLRCRKLRKQGLLSERDGPGGGAGVAPSSEHPRGLAAVYRLIPAWPRWLMVMNLACLYCYTGTVKNGAVWAKGDALYYALNMDHFYRFYPQEISSVPFFGLFMFRLATWITHWWEAFFPLMVVGLVTRWAIREQLEPLRGTRLWCVRAAWLGLGLMVMAVVLVAFPVHHPPQGLIRMERIFAGGWLGLLAVIGGLWWILGTGRMRLKIRGTTYTLDREWFCKWFLGRRVWLTLGLMFHGNLQVFMNIGMFAPIMMSTYLFCFQGDEPGRILRFFGRGLARIGIPMPATITRGEPPLPAEDRTLPHHIRDARRLPDALVYSLLALAAFGVFLQGGPLIPWFKEAVLGYAEADAATGLHFGWTVVAIAVILIIYTYADGHRGTRGYVVKLGSLATALVAYLWFMSVGIDDPVEAETWRHWRIGVNVALVGLLVLQQFPAIHRRLAAIGLTFSAPDRPTAQLLAEDPHSGRPRAPWAYHPGGRMLAGFLVVYHITAIAFWELPEKDSVSTFRIKGREAFSTWVVTTQTDQQWGMFAPNPPRHNVFMRIFLTDENGEQWDVRNDVYAPERKPIPWIWNDRMRKMNRRVIGGESGKGDWYQKWYARYLCREWARTHRGVMPQKIELFKIVYKMPSPELVTRQGWYSPEKLLVDTGSEERKYTEKCANAVHGQLPNYIRERHNLPLLDEKGFKAWVKNKKKAWDRRFEPPKPKTPAKTPPKPNTAAATKTAPKPRFTPTKMQPKTP